MRSVSTLLALSVVAALASCGGGDESQTASNVSLTELQLTDQQRFSLQGDWPIGNDATRAFLVRSQSEWDQKWSERRASVNCNPPVISYNQALCSSDGPPPVDFSRYSLVALLLTSVFHFDEPTPRSIYQDDGGPLSVSYRYISPSKAPFFITVEGRFFLVPRTTAALQTSVQSCSLSC
jgi:hypothetical protein